MASRNHIYGPLANFVTDPIVVFLRINALALMTLKDPKASHRG